MLLYNSYENYGFESESALLPKNQSYRQLSLISVFTQCTEVFFELFRVITLLRHYLVNYIVYGQFYISAYSSSGIVKIQGTK